MTVINRRFRVVAMGAAAALLIAVAACSSAKTTPTLAPTASPSPSASETATDTPTPTPTSTDTPFVAPTDTPVSSPTAVVTIAPTPTPTPTPSGPAGGCSGLDTNKAWWAAESPHFKFTVYCGVMPGGWYFSTASDDYKIGKIYAKYKGPAGAFLTINEGAFCTSACSTGTSIGSAKFGDLTGGLYSLPTGGYAIYVDPGTAHGYSAVGTGMTQATFTNLAAALMQVPKS
jgi:hypothetical protein